MRVNKEMPGHVANRLQAALAREVYYLVAEGVVSAADVDTALCWGPGLRWGIMGNMMLNHLGGGPGGIEHFFQQFTGPMTAWWKTLGSPVLTPEVQKKLINSVHAEVGSRTIEELEAERDEVLLGLIELRNKVAKSSQRDVLVRLVCYLSGTMASSTTPKRRLVSASNFCGTWRRIASSWWPLICRSRPSATWQSMVTHFAAYRSSGILLNCYGENLS